MEWWDWLRIVSKLITPLIAHEINLSCLQINRIADQTVWAHLIGIGFSSSTKTQNQNRFLIYNNEKHETFHREICSQINIGEKVKCRSKWPSDDSRIILSYSQFNFFFDSSSRITRKDSQRLFASPSNTSNQKSSGCFHFLLANWHGETTIRVIFRAEQTMGGRWRECGTFFAG